MKSGMGRSTISTGLTKPVMLALRVPALPSQAIVTVPVRVSPALMGGPGMKVRSGWAVVLVATLTPASPPPLSQVSTSTESQGMAVLQASSPWPLASSALPPVGLVRGGMAP